MTLPFPSPTEPAGGRAEVFGRYLEFFRESVIAKVLVLADHELRMSRLPSGWTPLELLKHLRYVELRWIVWGFEGQDVGDPWGDNQDGRWHVGDDETRDGLIAELRAQGERTTAAIAANDLDAVGEPGPRWDGKPPATLERVLFHLVQEYARHMGHLDIVAELAGVPTDDED